MYVHGMIVLFEGTYSPVIFYGGQIARRCFAITFGRKYFHPNNH